MIELRWLERPFCVVEGGLPDGFTATIPTVRVLQYRETRQVWNGGADRHEESTTGWCDVPVVREGE